MLVEIKNRVKEVMAGLNSVYKKNIGMPEVLLNPRLRTTAGRANGKIVEFAGKLYPSNKDDYMTDTIPHEVCHYFVINMYGNNVQAHGTHWQNAMHALNVSPKRCHTMNVTAARQRRFEYNCGCRVHLIATVTHNRIQAGTRSFSCKHCKNELRYGV